MIFDMLLDTIHADADRLPVNMSACLEYMTGSHDIKWTLSDTRRFPNCTFIRVDQTASLDVYQAGGAELADVERGAGTMSEFIKAAKVRASKHWPNNLYCSLSNFTPAISAVHNAGLTGQVNYHIADYDMSMDQAIRFIRTNNDVMAVQFASPTSNPRTLVPGTAHTLKEVNCDLSIKRGEWYPPRIGVALFGAYVETSAQ